MVLIPIERLKALESAMRGDAPRYVPKSPLPITNSQPDVELKLLRQKQIRKPKKRKPTQTALSTPNTKTNAPSPESFAIRKRPTAKAFLKHLKMNKDRIKFDDGSLQFDGIKSGDSDIGELASAFMDSSAPQDTPGWDMLMRALDGTDAPASLYKRWTKSHTKGDWGSLMRH